MNILLMVLGIYGCGALRVRAWGLRLMARGLSHTTPDGQNLRLPEIPLIVLYIPYFWTVPETPNPKPVLTQNPEPNP